MKRKLHSMPFILILLLLVQPAYASNIVDITIDEMGIPFLLDDEGHVWGFQEPSILDNPIKLPNLNHIKKIAPYIAVNEKGQVFTWSIDVKKTTTEMGEIDKVGYTIPQKFGDLQDVTMVAYSKNHFLVVIGNQEIVEWAEIPDPNSEFSFGIKGYGPIKRVFTGAGIKAISIIAGEQEGYGRVALLGNGTVMGWGVNPTGQITRYPDTPGIVLTQLPDAVSIAINAYHTVVLGANGEVKFWGGCDLYGWDGNGKLWTSPRLGGVTVM